MLPYAASGSGSGSGSGKAPARFYMLQAAAVEDTYGFAQAGSRMREWMFTTPEELAQVPEAPKEARFSARALPRWGWVRSDIPREEHEESAQVYGNLLNGLKGVGDRSKKWVLSQDKVRLTRESTTTSVAIQQKPYKVDGQQVQHVSTSVQVRTYSY